MGQGCLSLGSTPPTTSGPGGMFLSTDKGENWQPINKFPTAEGVRDLSSVSVYGLLPDPHDAHAYYWLSRGHGIFYTYDDGKTWRQPLGQFTTGFAYSLAVHPKNKCILYGTTGSKVYRTDDCGRTWRELYREARDTRVSSLAFNPFEPHQIFMGETNGDLLVSNNEGVSWKTMNRFGVNLAKIVFDPRHQGLMYVVSRGEGLYRSGDAGETWAELRRRMNDYPGALEYRRFLLHPSRDNALYWISTYGILISRDRGDNWSPIDLITPPGSALIYAFAVNPQNDKEMYYTATINGRSTLYKTTDGGKTWITRKLPSAQIPTTLSVHPEKGSVLYLGFTIPPSQ